MSDDAPAAADALPPNDPPPDAGPEERGGDAALSSAGPFDLGGVRDLLRVMEQFGVSEIDLRSDSQRWHVRRGAVAAIPAAAPVAVAAPVAAPAQPQAAAPAPAAAPAGRTIDSPTVGTFYASPSPDDPPFVKVGDAVEADTVVCLVEAMKVFNQIQAEASGTIAEVLVKAGEAVEFGQPLFRLA